MGRGILLSLVLLPLAGCSAAWSVSGAFADRGETLTGSATRYMDGGTIELFGNRGSHCTGTFTHNSKAEGLGVMLCDDRRNGRFSLTLAKKRGQGELGGRAFSFALGDIREMREVHEAAR